MSKIKSKSEFSHHIQAWVKMKPNVTRADDLSVLICVNRWSKI